MITVMAGGVGAAKFLSGLVRVLSQEEITVIVNTADDAVFHGLHVSPDIDTIIYTLAGVVNTRQGWGLQGDTFNCLNALKRFGHETWFHLGDRDLATHIHRTLLLQQGHSLSEVTERLARAFGLKLRLLPMSEQRVATRVVTPEGTLEFQEYMVKRGATDRVISIYFAGVEEALPAPGVLEALKEAEGVVLAPSNPLISIGPILAVKGIRDALRETPGRVVAISPIVGGVALKGPAHRMLEDLGLEVSPYQVASLYQDFLDVFIMDKVDAEQKPRVEALGVRAVVTNTVMKGRREKVALARKAVELLRSGCP